MTCRPTPGWGPRAWYKLHLSAVNYPARATKVQARRAALWLEAFFQRLPCVRCRRHIFQYARAHPPELTGSAAFQLWLFRFHNSVNRRLGKPFFPFEDYRLLYSRELQAAAIRSA